MLSRCIKPAVFVPTQADDPTVWLAIHNGLASHHTTNTDREGLQHTGQGLGHTPTEARWTMGRGW